MIEISALAREKIQSHLQQAERPGYWLRVEIVGRAMDDFIYRLIFMPPEFRKPEEMAFDVEGVHLVVDPLSARYLKGAKLDYVETREHAGFKIDNPNPLWLDPQATRVDEVIQAQINPGIAMHGGRVTLLDVADGVAYISMGGGCQGCGLANVTLKQGVEKMIMAAVPEISQVVDTTEHALGSNPYYRGPSGDSPLA